MSSPKGSRTKYTDEQLIEYINKYQKAHPMQRFTLTDLSNWSGIPRVQFYRHEKVKQLVDDINSTPITISGLEDYNIPSVQEIFDKCNGNEDILKKEFGKMIDIIISLKKECDKKTIQKIQIENNKLKAKIKELETQINQQKQDELKSSAKAISKMSNDEIRNNLSIKSFKDQFDGLFN